MLYRSAPREVCYLFSWSRVWGFSTASSVADFAVSLNSVSVSSSIL